MKTFEVLVMPGYAFWPPLEKDWAGARLVKAQDYADAAYQVAQGQPPKFSARVRVAGTSTAGALYTISPQERP